MIILLFLQSLFTSAIWWAGIAASTPCDAAVFFLKKFFIFSIGVELEGNIYIYEDLVLTLRVILVSILNTIVFQLAYDRSK